MQTKRGLAERQPLFLLPLLHRGDQGIIPLRRKVREGFSSEMITQHIPPLLQTKLGTGAILRRPVPSDLLRAHTLYQGIPLFMMQRGNYIQPGGLTSRDQSAQDTEQQPDGDGQQNA